MQKPTVFTYCPNYIFTQCFIDTNIIGIKTSSIHKCTTYFLYLDSNGIQYQYSKYYSQRKRPIWYTYQNILIYNHCFLRLNIIFQNTKILHKICSTIILVFLNTIRIQLLLYFSLRVWCYYDACRRKQNLFTTDEFPFLRDSPELICPTYKCPRAFYSEL